MPDQGIFPRYPSLLPLISNLITSSFLGKKRSFEEDARLSCAHIEPPIKIFGQENIPAHGGYLIVVNHYYRPGFGTWWLAFAVSSVVHSHTCWMVTGALTEYHEKKNGIMKSLSGFLIRRLAKVYGFITMPPMPPDPADVMERALSVRLLVKTVRQHPDFIYAIAPEGGDNRAGGLGDPPPGVGRFIKYLNQLGLCLIPCGVYEESGTLFVRFGSPFMIQLPRADDKVDEDRMLRKQIMQAIACLLPDSMRGEFNL